MGVKSKNRQSLPVPVKTEDSVIMDTSEVKPSSGQSQILITNLRAKTDQNELIKFIKSTSNAQFDDIQVSHGPYVLVTASKNDAAKILNSCNGMRFDCADLKVASIDKGSVYTGKSNFDPDNLNATKVVKVVGDFNSDEIIQMIPNAKKTSTSNRHIIFEMPSIEASKAAFDKILKYKKIKNLKFKIFYEKERSTDGLASTTKVMVFNLDLSVTKEEIMELCPDATFSVRNINLLGSYYLEFADNAKCKEYVTKLHNFNLGDRLLRAELFTNDFKLKISSKPHAKTSAQAKEIFPNSTNTKIIATPKGPLLEFTFKNRNDWVEAMDKVWKGRIGNYTVWTQITKIENGAKSKPSKEDKKKVQVLKNKKGLIQAGSSDEEEEAKPSKANLLKRARDESDEEDDDEDDSDEADSDDEDPDLDGDEADSDDDEDDDEDDEEEDDEDDDDSEGEEAPKLVELKKKPSAPMQTNKNNNNKKGNFKKGTGSIGKFNKNKRFRTK